MSSVQSLEKGKRLPVVQSVLAQLLAHVSNQHTRQSEQRLGISHLQYNGYRVRTSKCVWSLYGKETSHLTFERKKAIGQNRKLKEGPQVSVALKLCQ